MQLMQSIMGSEQKAARAHPQAGLDGRRLCQLSWLFPQEGQRSREEDGYFESLHKQ